MIYIEALVLVNNDDVTDSLGDAVVGWALLLTNVALLTLVVSNQWGHHKRMAKLRESMISMSIELMEAQNPISADPSAEHMHRSSEVWGEFGGIRVFADLHEFDVNDQRNNGTLECPRMESVATSFDNPMYKTAARTRT